MGKGVARWFVAAAVVIAIAIGIYAWVEQERARPATLHHSMTAAEEAYLSEIQVTGARMSSASNFLGNNLFYFDAQISNRGTRTVRQVRLDLAFMDPFGDVVYRQTEPAVAPTTPTLKPGTTEPLHFTFEQLPAEWNQGPPTVVVSYVSF